MAATPGPWFVQSNGIDAPTIHTHPTEYGIYIVHPGIESDGGVCGRTDAEGIANAKLIAAAPDLADALERAVERLAADGYGGDFEGTIVGDARIALRLAGRL
jgi:hypothetical protein